MRNIFILLIMLVSLGACRDTCRNLKCENNSFCYDGTCICAKWYSGEKCQLQFNRNYEGAYVGKATQDGRSIASTNTLVADDMIPNRMYVNTDQFYLDFETDSTFVIPDQELIVLGDTLQIYGGGKFATDFLEFEYGEAIEEEIGYSYDQVLVQFEGLREEVEVIESR